MGVLAATALNKAQEFAVGDGTDASTVAVIQARVPSVSYDKHSQKTIDDVDPVTAYTLWDVDDNSAVSSEFQWAMLKVYGGVTLMVEETINGGLATQRIRKYEAIAGVDYGIAGVQANSTEADGAFGSSITGRVTKIRVYNPDASQTGKVELFLFAEPV